MTKPIDITDEFQEPNGEWENYTSIVPIQNEALRKQKHVDLRSFVPDKAAAKLSMFFLDSFSMGRLDEGEIELYESTIVTGNVEHWSHGTVAAQSDRNNWNGIKLTCAANTTTTTESVVMITST